MTNSQSVDLDASLLIKQLAALGNLQCHTIHLGEFHTGLEFFKLWQLWQDHRHNNQSRLHVIATASHPLSLVQLKEQLANTSHPSQNIAQLFAQYPPAISGVHRLIFKDERLSLDLWFGDVVSHLNISVSPITSDETQSTFVVIGAGIAGLSITEALTRRGYSVTLVEQDQPLSGASGNPCALLLSKLPKLNRVSHNLQTMGALTTARWWGNWVNDVVISSGALLKIDEDDREKIKNYPTDIVQTINAQQASERSGIVCQTDYMFMPRAISLNPSAIRHHVLASPLVTLIKASANQLVQNESSATWTILDADKKPIAQANKVIIANAKDSTMLCPTLPPLTVIRGQISWLPLTPKSPKISLGYGGYLTTFQDKMLFGSSFIRDDVNQEIRNAEHESNLALLKEEFPEFSDTLPAITQPSTTFASMQWQGRASLRALPRDSMPVVGQVPNMTDVFVLAGLGSKGFSFAPLCAELLAAQMLGEALPMTNQLAHTIRPDRFIKKERVRKPYYKPPEYL